MLRLPLILIGVATIWACGGGVLLAQDGGSWPAYQLKDGWSGPGFYLSLVKIILSWLVFAAWVRSTDWVSRDCRAAKLNYIRWNPIVMGSFMAAFILLWLLPYFWLGFFLLLIAYVGPLAAYIQHRNSKVPTQQKVLTRDHLRHWFADRFSGVKAERVDPRDAGPPVKLLARGGATERDDSAHLLAARQAPGLQDARRLIADCLSHLATSIMLDYTQQSVVVRYMVDGVWHNGEPLERETGDPTLDALKIICGLDPQERQKRQEGQFAAEYNDHGALEIKVVEDKLTGSVKMRAGRSPADGRIPTTFKTPKATESADGMFHMHAIVEVDPGIDFRGVGTGSRCDLTTSLSYVATLVSQGTKTGERAVMQFEETTIPRPTTLYRTSLSGLHTLEGKRTKISVEFKGKQSGFDTLDSLGMRPKVQERFTEVMNSKKGFMLFSAMPGNGLRTLTNLALRNQDRFMREFMAVEDEKALYENIENVPVTTYSAAAGESPATVLPKVFHQEPRVVVVRDLVDGKTVGMLCDQIANNRLIVGTIRAKDGAEALLRVLATKVPPDKFAKAISAVVNVRLIRKLCTNCKEGYQPTPQILAQLRIPQGRIQALYRPPQQSEEVCPECQGTGYKGRTGIFELLVVNDNVRRMLAAIPKPDLLRQAAKKARMWTLQDEGILLVAKGVTSLPELMRVLKQ